MDVIVVLVHFFKYFWLDRKEYEHNFIENIVKNVSNKINRILLHVADYLVGLEPRIL